jgi:FtsH-binding integral membrane protein
MSDDTGPRQRPATDPAPDSTSEQKFLHRVALVYGLGLMFFLFLAAVWSADAPLLLVIGGGGWLMAPQIAKRC